MKSLFSSKQKFSLRKFKFGLASALIALSIFGLGTTVSADQVQATSPAPQSQQVAQPASAATTQTPSATEQAAADLQATTSQPIVPADQAQTGDVIDQQVSASPVEVTETQTATQESATAHATVDVKTTSLADKSEPVGKQAPVVTVWESQKNTQVDGRPATQQERVVKTQLVEVVKGADVVKEEAIGTADIVFVIDHSASMQDEIQSVRDNIATFVDNLNKNKINARLGLADYEDTENVNYADFGGSKFTNDPEAFKQALNQIQMDGAYEQPTVPLSYIAAGNHYDWSTGTRNKRFAILVTDEGALVAGQAPSFEETIKALNAAGISTSVISETSLESEYHSLYSQTQGQFIDINGDYATTLTDDIGNWVIKSVTEGTSYKIVSDHYDITVIVTAENAADPVLVVDPSCPPASSLEHTSQTASPVAYHGSAQEQETLPETGDETSRALGLLGISALLASATIIVKERRRQD